MQSAQIRNPWALAKEGSAVPFALADNPWRAVGVVPVQAILPVPMLPPVIAPSTDDRANDAAARELQHLFTQLLETVVTRERDAFCREFDALARAATALGHLLAPCGEFLPVILGSYDYCWFNCLTEHDAADWDRCEGERRENARPHHPPFREVRRYEFFPDRVADAPAIFQLDRGGLQLFCTDTLKDAIDQADLTGFALEHLWSSGTGGIRRPRIGMEGFGGEAGRLRQSRNEQVRRDMLDRMRREGLTPALPSTTHS